MPRQRGSISITIRRRPPIGPVRLTRFIRRRLTLFLPTLFMMSVGCKGRKVQPRLRWRSTQQMLLRPRRRAVRQLSQVLLLQTNRAKHQAEKRLPWAQRQRSQMLGWKLPALMQQLDSRLRPRANQVRKLALSHSNRHLNCPRLAANRQQLRRKLSEPRRHRLHLHPANRTINKSLSKQVRWTNPLRRQRPQTFRQPPLRARRAEGWRLLVACCWRP